jgi:biopolymer transport protein ExbB
MEMETVNLDFWVLIRQGAISTYPLLACSVLIVGITLERLWSLRGIIASTTGLAEQVVPLLSDGKKPEARAAIEAHSPCPARRVFGDLIDHPAASVEHLDRIADERQFEEVQGAGSYLWILGTIGAAAPFIGLFGTVVGIIRAFHAMAIAGTGGFAVVAAGISEALIATALGLAVGITALVLYNYFQARVDRVDAALRIGSARVIDAVATVGGVRGVQ